MSEIQALILPAVNLLLLIAFLGWKLRKPVQDFVEQRHFSIKEELVRVSDMLADAQKKHREFSEKLAGFKVEAQALRSQAQADAKEAKSRIVNHAQVLSKNIVSDASTTAQTLFGDLKTRLSQELGGQVIARAEKILKDRLTGEDQSRIRKEFSKQMGGAQ